MRDKEKTRLLAEKQYDDDDDDDFESVDGRTSTELADLDREVLDDDYEDDGLLHSEQSSTRRGLKHYLFPGRAYEQEEEDAQRGSSRNRKGSQVDARRSRRRKKLKGESEKMFEMEEGGRLTASSEEDDSSRGSREVDLQRLGILGDQKSARWKRRLRHVGIVAIIILAFGVIFFFARRATIHSASITKLAQETLWNGTAIFPPTTILISLDGFRADFLQRDSPRTLNDFISTGVSPQYMLPSFPSVTFPNHYTMATGLYPESHGIVGNTFWDPEMLDEFFYTHPQVSMLPKWWGGEPLWVTAEKQGVRSAVHMWPGSEAHIGGIDPSHLDQFNAEEALDKKAARILSFLDLPGPEHEKFSTMEKSQQRPQLIAAYVPNVDSDGHKYGPNSTEIRATIAQVDDMIAQVFNGLQLRNLTKVVNVVIVSDHGMATTDVSRLVQLEDLVDTSKIAHTDGWPSYGLRPKDAGELRKIYDDLKKKTQGNPNLEVYLRDENMPERYHFQNNARIAPLWIVPKTGWAIVTKDDFDIAKALKNGDVYHPRGLHGYDLEHPLMRAIFVARGPAFPHAPNSRVEVFREYRRRFPRHLPSLSSLLTFTCTENVEVYNIVCDSLGIQPVANNGTLRLPLKAVGLHSDSDAPQPETPTDPPTHSLPGSTSTDMPDASHGYDGSITWTAPTPSPSEEPSEPSNKDGDAANDPETARQRINKAWQWLSDKLKGAKEWAHHLLHPSPPGAAPDPITTPTL